MSRPIDHRMTMLERAVQRLHVEVAELRDLKETGVAQPAGDSLDRIEEIEKLEERLRIVQASNYDLCKSLKSQDETIKRQAVEISILRTSFRGGVLRRGINAVSDLMRATQGIFLYEDGKEVYYKWDHKKLKPWLSRFFEAEKLVADGNRSKFAEGGYINSEHPHFDPDVPRTNREGGHG